MKRTIKTGHVARTLSMAVLGATSVLAITQVPGSVNTSAKLPVVSSSATTSASPGYYVVGEHGGATGFGATPNGASVTGSQSGVVAAAANPTGKGYWTVTSSGQVAAHGGATFYGDTYTDGITGLSGTRPLNAPIVGIASTSNGQGYWLVAADGGVFNFGNASFYGSTYTFGITGFGGSHPLAAPIVGIVGTPTGSGYWLVGADGGVFDFGNAHFYGSTYTYGVTGLTGSHPLNAPIVGAVAAPNGDGYYLVGADGGVFDFGSAKFNGSTYSLGYTGLGGSHPLPGPITDIMPNPVGPGYYVVCKTGKVLALGGAPALGNANIGPVVAIIPSVPVHQPQSPAPTVPTTPVVPTAPTVPTTPVVPTTPYVPTAPVVEPLALTSTTLNVSGNTVDTTLSASGGDGGYTFSSSDLPSGLTLSSDGTLTGTLTETATTTLTFSVAVTDAAGATATGTISLVDTIAPLTITTTNIGTFTNVNIQLMASGGDGSYTWSVPSNAADPLPSGLALSSSGAITGSLSGDSTEVYNVSVMVTDGSGVTDSATVTITYNPVTITTSTINLTAGTAASVQLDTDDRDMSGLTFSVPSTGTLPSGLTLDSTGLLSGTPTTSDPSATTFMVTVLNGANASVGQTSVTINIAGGSAVIPIQQVSSSNWAGIVDTGSGVSSVSGTFVVPTLSSTQPTYCTDVSTDNPSECSLSEWVGVDGDSSYYLLQAGVQATWTPSGAEYTPWYEVITPNDVEPEEIIPGWSNVNAGDSVTVTLSKQQSGGWDIVLKDNTTDQWFNSDSINFTDYPDQNNPADFKASDASPEDAEWIAETPEYGTPYAAMPYVSSGGNFSALSLTMSSVEQSYAVTRACLGSQGANGECLTPSTNQTAPIDYGSDYNLNPFTFNWSSASAQSSDALQRTTPSTVLGNLLP